MFIVWNCCLHIADFETTLLKPVFYLQKMMNFMKMRTFYKKLPLFTKKKTTQFCILIKNSNLKCELL